MLGENWPIWFTISINLLSSVTEEGGFIANIAVFFFGSGEIPLRLITCPER